MKAKVSIVFAILLLFGCSNGIRPDLPEFVYKDIYKDTLNTAKIQKGKPVILVYFSTSCPNCQRLTHEIIEHIDQLSNVEIYLMMPESIEKVDVFSHEYKLDSIKNLHLGEDYTGFMHKHFGTNATPTITIYNSQKKLHIVQRGFVPVSQLKQWIDNIDKT